MRFNPLLCVFVCLCVYDVLLLYVSIQLDVLLTRKYINHTVSTYHKFSCYSFSRSLSIFLSLSHRCMSFFCCFVRCLWCQANAVCRCHLVNYTDIWSTVVIWHECAMSPIRIPLVNCKLRMNSVFEIGREKRSALNLQHVRERMSVFVEFERAPITEWTNESTAKKRHTHIENERWRKIIWCGNW